MSHKLQCVTIIVLTLTFCMLDVFANGFEPNTFIVWGPGLRSEVVVPARFFFVQTMQSGENFTGSLGKDPFNIHMSDSSGNTVRAWVQQFDRNDGSYIVRYKSFASYEDVTIHISYKGNPVGNSPYLMKGHVYHDQCDCPIPDVEDWFDAMQCPSTYSQIEGDLSHWKDPIDMTEVAKEAISRFSSRGRHSLCHYVIKDNKIYRKTYGQHVGFKMFMDAILLSLTRKVKLPDFELFTNLGDWPLEKKSPDENPLPIFSWCGSDETMDIIMPTYDLTESTLQTMGRVTLDLLSVQGNTGPKWANKSDVAFWRGRDSRQERLDLVKTSKKHPDILDAKLTNMFFFEKTEDLLPLVKPVSFFQFFESKYQLNIDGTVAAYRFPYLLAGDSVVFKQDSPYYEHFYKDLEPFVHYIPLKRDLSDLMDQLKWAKEHEEEVQKIAKNGQEFVRSNLMSGDIFCYHVKLFERYSRMLKSPPVVQDDMELVEQTEDRHSHCDCHRKQTAKDEL